MRGGILIVWCIRYVCPVTWGDGNEGFGVGLMRVRFRFLVRIRRGRLRSWLVRLGMIERGVGGAVQVDGTLRRYSR
jgi:hypothetical protein